MRFSQILGFWDKPRKIGTLSESPEHILEVISKINFEEAEYYSIRDDDPLCNLNVVETETYTLSVWKEKNTFLLEKFGVKNGILTRIKDDSATELISIILNEPLLIEWYNKQSEH